ncbi:MAG: hypothetical protein WEB58_12180 [Planctomycetaceae bacterium]
MPLYCIIEIDDGWTIAERKGDENAMQAAERFGGVLIDAGPYENYDEVQDALTALETEDEIDASSDTPASQSRDERDIEDR